MASDGPLGPTGGCWGSGVERRGLCGRGPVRGPPPEPRQPRKRKGRTQNRLLRAGTHLGRAHPPVPGGAGRKLGKPNLHP